MAKKLDIKDGYYINGEKTKIISGSIHYFRVVPEYWEDRILKLIELGCNTIETYVPWNFHEPYEGKFNFSGMADLDRFLTICSEKNLNIILRLSPYICAEWEFGGFPAWLLKYENLRLRSDCPIFLEKVDNFYKKIAPFVVKHLGKNGGNVIMLQVENEYGSFSYDKEYLMKIREIMIDCGLDYNLFTSDGPWDNLMHQGTISNFALPTGNFGSKAIERFGSQLEFVKHKDLLMCMEFWDGWFDCWGDKKHNTTAAEDSAKELEEVLKLGNVNLYMFHGGTNFGFWNGSNFKDKLLPRVTSYDYDAPLSESGDKREKFDYFKSVINKYSTNRLDKKITSFSEEKYENNFSSPKKFSLLDNLENISRKVIKNKYPLNMEKLDQNYGYIIYKSFFESNYDFIGKLDLWSASDRVHVFVNKKLVKILENDQIKHGLMVPIMKGKNEIMIMVENLGRVNYGPYIHMQKKGICGNVTLDKIILINWEHFVIDFENLENIYNKNLSNNFNYIESPTINIFELNSIKISGDTFIDTTLYNKGQIFVNNFNLGRYWKIGPQKNLYVPKYLFNQLSNKVLIFETDNAKIDQLFFTKNESL